MDEIKDYPPYLDYAKPHKTQTNADRIRSMSDEELAKTLGDKCICPPTSGCAEVCGDCDACWLEWLQNPAENPKEECLWQPNLTLKSVMENTVCNLKQTTKTIT